MNHQAIKIAAWIHSKVKEAGAKGVVLGMSGGLDSSVVGVLCKRALDNTTGLIMPIQSLPLDETHAMLVAKQFDIKTKLMYLDKVYDAFESILWDNANMLVCGNIKARLRMMTLYYYANSHNYLVVGCGNRSEIVTGYFTKFGDGASDILPIGDLLKTEVRSLAKELKIPNEIIEKKPSAGLWKGQFDEDELEMTYSQIDAAIKALESKRGLDSIPDAHIGKMKKLYEKSSHKRYTPPIFKNQRRTT